jgi:hypothetical protein
VNVNEQRKYIGKMRQRLGLEPEDTSRDDYIDKMTPHERLRLICGWELGYGEWADSFIGWAKDAGFKISEPRPAPPVPQTVTSR